MDENRKKFLVLASDGQHLWQEGSSRQDALNLATKVALEHPGMEVHVMETFAIKIGPVEKGVLKQEPLFAPVLPHFPVDEAAGR